MARPFIIIPALNEEETIEAVINSASKYAEILVVCDGCTDLTAQKAREAGAHVVESKTNQGYDATLNLGFKNAYELGATHFLTIDADGQHPHSMIPIFLDGLNDYQILMGNRNKYQRVSEYIFSLWTNFKWGIKDPLCGMKGYTRLAYEANGHFDHSNSIGTELALKGIKKGLEYKEIDISCHNRTDQPRFGSSLKAEYKILKAMYTSVFFSH
jgi:glycosyltransferase involved in cell wall biosynthesis